jgi:hypothetical protein
VRQVNASIPNLKHNLTTVTSIGKDMVRTVQLVNSKVSPKAMTIGPMVNASASGESRQLAIEVIQELRIIPPIQYPDYLGNGESGVNGGVSRDNPSLPWVLDRNRNMHDLSRRACAAALLYGQRTVTKGGRNLLPHDIGCSSLKDLKHLYALLQYVR